MGLGGVTVQLSGVSSASTVTDNSGQYAFTGLRMGSYSVEISGFDNDEIGFSNTAASVTVGTGESKIASFDGTYLRTAGIQGQVSVEGVGLEGVNVSVTGGPDGEDMSTTTDAAGLYSFAKLRAGDYSVGISGYDNLEFEFNVTSQNVTIALGETANVPFEGTLLRTSGVAGRVSVGGMGIGDVTVTVSADGMDDVTAMTDASGQYAISALAAGDYAVTISGYDAVEYSFTDSQDVTLAMDATMIVNFEGMALRTASVAVSVTADGEGVAGAAATLTQITGATSGTILGTKATDGDGGATFGPLLAGTYRVDIAVDSDEIDFESTNWTGQVATGTMAEATFAGTINRTASIGGMVTVDGEGMAGVMVTLSGGADESMETGDDGSYSFGGLRKGDYTVSITNPDENRYEFGSMSESVNLAVGQEQSVSFAGAMVTSSSISGRVGLDDGTGVEGVMVTLSGDADDEMTTPEGGVYTFTGLGAGDYTVSITLSDEQEAAYNFADDETSKSVTLVDDDQQTVNFTGAHDMSASVTVSLFIDEAMKNDMFDEGEDAFPTPEMLAMVAQLELSVALPVALEGPGVGETNPSTPMPDGSVVFSDLRAGEYQLTVSDISAETLAMIASVAPQLAAVLQDFAYGGPAAGYPLNVGVGEQNMQHAPIDITHTTVHFTASLKSGEDDGEDIPGATVNLYSDAAGANMVGSGMTDEMGMTAIRVARAGTTGNTVHAKVSHDDYDGDGTTAVMWDPKKTYTMGANTNDIVNLNVDFTFGGATITTEYGGGDELAGWAVSVTTPGEDDEMVAVEDGPEALDDDGMEAFSEMVDAVPATYTIAVAEDEDQENDLDGGESYEATSLEYTHDGLSLAATMDAGMIEATYTTQTLKVYVHHELDQVLGYSGNILAGDERDDGKVSVGIRYIDDNGRSKPFTNADMISTPRGNGAAGVWTFSNIPADHRVIAHVTDAQDPADDDYESIMLLDPDELAAYTSMEENGVTGGAFGAMGGFSHTVELCPLQTVDPTGQDHGECGSFAYVNTYSVSGLIWKNEVLRSNDGANDDEFLLGPDDDEGPTFVPGITVSLDPVDGKNLAGDAESATTTEDPVRTAGENRAGTDILDETHEFDFGRIAAGVYAESVSDGWRVRLGIKGTEVMVANVLNPLGRTEEDVTLDVTPATTTVYGYVRDSEEYPVEGAIVDVNGVEATTDFHGRYIAEYVATATRTISGHNSNQPIRGHIFVGDRPRRKRTHAGLHEGICREQPDQRRRRNFGRRQQSLDQRCGHRVRQRRRGRRCGDPGGRRGSDQRGHERCERRQARDGRRRHLHGRDRGQGHRQDCGCVRDEGRHELRACGADCSGPRWCGCLGHQLHRLPARHDFGPGERSGRQRPG